LTERDVADLIVRNVDPKLVRALKARAGRKGVSAEAEHRAILAAALSGDDRPSLAAFLLTMPKLDGHEDVFDRVQDRDSRPAPFDRKPKRRVSR
jgi:plasmid stability protein